jgi:hypothetical protein
MFSTLFRTSPVDLGGGVIAHVTMDPTGDVMRAIQRAELPDPFDNNLVMPALMVENWSGNDVPTDEEWGSLDDDTTVKARVVILRKLPRKPLNALVVACGRALRLDDDEKKPSGEVSE